jgi:hypothetical protein
LFSLLTCDTFVKSKLRFVASPAHRAVAK